MDASLVSAFTPFSKSCALPDHYLMVLDFFIRLLSITSVSVETGFMRAFAHQKKQDTSRAGKSTQIADIGKMRDQQTIKPCLAHRYGQFFLSSYEIHECR